MWMMMTDVWRAMVWMKGRRRGGTEGLAAVDSEVVDRHGAELEGVEGRHVPRARHRLQPEPSDG